MARLLILPDTLLSSGHQASVLDRASIRVRTARTTEEALRIAAVWRPDLLAFGDAPEVPTAQRCRALRESEALRDTKLILVTDRPEGDSADLQVDRVTDERALASTVSELLSIPARRAPRIGTQILARFQGLTGDAGDQTPRFANIIDLSETGLVLECAHALRVGAPGRVMFFLPGVYERLGLDSVVHSVKDSALMRYAISFAEPPPDQAKVLRRFVENRLVRGLTHHPKPKGA